MCVGTLAEKLSASISQAPGPTCRQLACLVEQQNPAIQLGMHARLGFDFKTHTVYCGTVIAPVSGVVCNAWTVIVHAMRFCLV